MIAKLLDRRLRNDLANVRVGTKTNCELLFSLVRDKNVQFTKCDAPIQPWR